MRSAPHALAFNALLLWLTSIVSAGVGLLFWVIAARLYGPANVSAAAAGLSIVGLASSVGTIGLGIGFIKHLPSEERELSRAMSTVLLTSAALAGVLCVLFMLGAAAMRIGVPFTVAYAMLLSGASAAAATSAVRVHICLALGHSEFVPISLALSVIVRIAALLPLGMVAAAGLPIIAATALASATATGASLALLTRVSRSAHLRPVIDLSIVRTLLPFAAGAHASDLLGSLPAWLLPLMIGYLGRPEDLAFFYIPWLMGATIEAAGTQVALSLFARIAQGSPDSRRSTRMATGAAIAIASCVALPVFVMAGTILRIVGPGYAEHGTALLRTLAVAAVISAPVHVLFGRLQAENRLGALAWLSAAQTVSLMAGGAIGFVALGLPGVGLARASAALLTWLAAMATGAGRAKPHPTSAAAP